MTSVGGTELTPDTHVTRGWNETTWVNTKSSPPTQGSGSGCSAYEGKPAWQKDTGCSRRTTADVSMVAANVLGYDTYGGERLVLRVRDERVLTAHRGNLRTGQEPGLDSGPGIGGLHGACCRSPRHHEGLHGDLHSCLPLYCSRRLRRTNRARITERHRCVQSGGRASTDGEFRHPRGTPSDPTLTVDGSNLGAFAPPGSPEWGCSAAYSGDIFGGVGLNFGDTTAGWTAGQGGDCLGLIVSSWSSSKATLSLGSFSPDVTAMQVGDSYTFELQGHLFSGTLG